jgi:hypothetical protein
MLSVVMAAALTLIASAPEPPPPPPTPEQGIEHVLRELRPEVVLAPGVARRDFTTTAAADEVEGDVVEVDLGDPAVRTDLLTPGTVADRAPLEAMANRSGTVAAINGDFFDIERTNAPAGPAVQGGRPLKAAVPPERGMGPVVPGAKIDHVFTVGVDRIGRIDQLRLEAAAHGPSSSIPLVALNQYAVPVDGVGIFTSDWGDVDRSQTLCGSIVDRNAPCAVEQAEVVLRNGAVVQVARPIGGPVPPGDLILTGRDLGAAALSSLRIGDRVDVEYALVPASGAAPQFAVGGSPILFDGVPVAGLDDSKREPRSAVGVSADGRRMWMLTVDGRQSDSVGVTLRELASLLREMGVDDALNLDGGGSSTLVHREPDESEVTIVNDPAGSAPRMVPNGIGVFNGDSSPEAVGQEFGT